MADEPGHAETGSVHDPGSGSRPLKLFAAVATAFVLAIATAIGTGLGSRIVDLFDDEEQLLSYSAAEEISECGTVLFVREDRAISLATGTATEADWPTFRRANKAIPAHKDVIQVSIQGETARTITLTGINFSVERQRRPPGALFANPCGGGIIGRSVAADLDRTPPAIIRSSVDPEGDIGAVFDRPSGTATRPIRFPWTVSLTDPLLLNVITTTKRCYCIWRAEIPWRSGGKSGVIRIDNDGKGY